MPNDIYQLGAVAVVFGFAIREFFSWLKGRNNQDGRQEGNDLTRQGNADSRGDGKTTVLIYQELQKMNSNHLTHVQEAITDGNNRIIDTMNSNSQKQIELLGEIKGSLQK